MPEYEIPYRLVLEGKLIVEADSIDDAIDIAESGEWDDPTFKDRAEIVDWSVTGKAKLAE